MTTLEGAIRKNGLAIESHDKRLRIQLEKLLEVIEQANTNRISCEHLERRILALEEDQVYEARDSICTKNTTQDPDSYFCCPECQCTDVEETAWVNANTGLNTGDEPPRDVYWCPQCGENGDGEYKELATTTVAKPYVDPHPELMAVTGRPEQQP